MALTVVDFDTFRRYANKDDVLEGYLSGYYSNYSASGGPFPDTGRMYYASIAGDNYFGTTRNLGGPYTSFCYGQWWKGTSTQNYSALRLKNPLVSSNSVISLRFYQGNVLVYKGASTLVASAPFPVNVNSESWYFVEAFVNVNSSTGAIYLKIGNEVVINETGLNLGSDGVSLIDFAPTNGVELGPWYFGSASSQSDMCGPIAGDYLPANADTADDDFTPSAGSDSYAMVDEVQADDDSTYLASGTSGDVTVLDVAAIDSNLEDYVLAVKGVAKLKTSALSTKTIKVGVKSSSSIGQTDGVSPQLAYKDVVKLLTEDPATSSAWTASGVNAAQIHLEMP
jgi:hypothetical protein